MQVPYRQAMTVARILSVGTPDVLLDGAEQQLVQQVCTYWLQQRKRQTRIEQQLEVLLKQPTAQGSNPAPHHPTSLCQVEGVAKA